VSAPDRTIGWHGASFPPFIPQQNADTFIGAGQFDSIPVGAIFVIDTPAGSKVGRMYRKMPNGLRRIDSLKVLKQTRKECGLDDGASA
jgi:hypothetical protein